MMYILSEIKGWFATALNEACFSLLDDVYFIRKKGVVLQSLKNHVLGYLMMYILTEIEGGFLTALNEACFKFIWLYKLYQKSRVS
jgi:hypothetical protein